MSAKRGSRLKTLAEDLGLEIEFLEVCVQVGVVVPEELESEPPALSPAHLARLRRLRRLCAALDVDVFAGSIIVELLERLDERERDLAHLRRRTES